MKKVNCYRATRNRLQHIYVLNLINTYLSNSLKNIAFADNYAKCSFKKRLQKPNEL